MWCSPENKWFFISRRGWVCQPLIPLHNFVARPPWQGGQFFICGFNITIYPRFFTSRSNSLNDGTVKEHNLNPFDFWKEARTCRARCAVIFFSITQHRVSSGAPKIKRNSLNDNNFSTDGYFKEIPEQRKVGLFFTLCRAFCFFSSARKEERRTT